MYRGAWGQATATPPPGSPVSGEVVGTSISDTSAVRDPLERLLESGNGLADLYAVAPQNLQK